jgi:hypothetical protein
VAHQNGQNYFDNHQDDFHTSSNGSSRKIKPSNSNLLYENLFEELEVGLNVKLDSSLRESLKRILSDYEHTSENRRIEEKDQMINQLKSNLVELTEKRFRSALNHNSNKSHNSSKEASPALNESPQLNNSSIEFLLNEKDQRIKLLLDELNDSQNEINKLKRIIKEQDDVILSHNNNLYVSF